MSSSSSSQSRAAKQAAPRLVKFAVQYNEAFQARHKAEGGVDVLAKTFQAVELKRAYEAAREHVGKGPEMSSTAEKRKWLVSVLRNVHSKTRHQLPAGKRKQKQHVAAKKRPASAKKA